MTLTETLNRAWALLTPEAGDRGPIISLASLDHTGQPQLRTVVLRSAQRSIGQVAIYTDLRSAKVVEFQADARAAVLLWSAEHQVQLRLTGDISILSGEPTQLIWQVLRKDQRLAYGHQPAPGTVIERSDAWEDHPDPANLAVLSLSINSLEHVSLDPAGHRRALFRRVDDWAGQWLSP